MITEILDIEAGSLDFASLDLTVQQFFFVAFDASLFLLNIIISDILDLSNSNLISCTTVMNPIS